MNILVINGSPKGENSVTLQTMLYLEKCYPNNSFEYLHAGQKIKSLERDFSKAAESLERADLIIFSYPVYTFIAPYQLHRFIELIKENNIELQGKFATQFTTSKHFYDVTAHRYIQDNCCDLGIKYIKGLSADMEDLLKPLGQKQAKEFFEHTLFCMENDVYEKSSIINAQPKNVTVTVPQSNNAQKGGYIVVLTTAKDTDTQLLKMIERFRAVCKRNTRVINLKDYPFKGGCLGCLNCAVSGKCVYKDGFDEYLRDTIQSAQAIVIAFTVKDHSMGATFKLYDDRQFCNGHRAVTMGMPMGYLVSGNYSTEFNLQMVIEGRAQVGSNFLAGVATDEENPDFEIDKLAENIEYALQNSYVPPQNFYGIGGMKIFRDLIWLMRGIMKADHKFYKEHKQYDFPQKKRGTMIAMCLLGTLISSDKMKAKAGNMMSEGMLMPYKKVLEKENQKQ